MTGQLDGRLSVRWLAGKTASRRLASCNDCQQGAGQLNSTPGCGQLTEVLGISDLFGSGLLPAHPAGSLSSGSFRPVAAHGNKDGALAGGL